MKACYGSEETDDAPAPWGWGIIVSILAYQLAIDEAQQKATETPEELTFIAQPARLPSPLNSQTLPRVLVQMDRY
jgi:hypothetical protein